MTDAMNQAGEGQNAIKAASAKTAMVKRLLPVAVILAGIVAFFGLGLNRYLTFDALSEHREALLGFVTDNPLLAPLIFILAYAAATAMSLPGAVVLTIAGGFLFGTLLGGLYVVIGATIGAVIIFLIAKTALGDALRSKAGPWMARMEAGFRENEFSYMLILRLVPLFPFWLVNLVPAFLGVSLGTFALATFVGIIPGSFAYASVGAGLGTVFDQGQAPGLEILADPKVWGPMVALIVLALVPIVYKRFAGKKAE